MYFQIGEFNYENIINMYKFIDKKGMFEYFIQMVHTVPIQIWATAFAITLCPLSVNKVQTYDKA
jgi:hypothetical protein